MAFKIDIMKFIISILLTALLSFVACLYLPWWSIAIAAFLVAALIHQKPWKAFVTGFVALLLLWGIMAWVISSNNHHLLTGKISLLLLKTDSPVLMVLVAAFIGALVAGMAALSGSYIRQRRQ